MKYFLTSLIVLANLNCSPKFAPDAGWGLKHWVLVEMKEVPVQQSGGRKDAYIGFETPDKRFSGNGGCNQFSGTYTVNKNDIKFGEVRSTKMSCVDIEFENTFLSVLNSVDRFEQRGNEIRLKRKKETLLVFRAQ
ncbi:MAG: META domain-containing protein [Chitinophagaceae bacterium]